MDSRRPSYSVNRPRVHSTGLPSPPPLIATTSSQTGHLVRRQLVPSPIRLVGHTTVHGRPRLHRPAGLRRRQLVFTPARPVYYAAVVGRLRLHCRPASITADWCPRLYGWLVTPPFMGVHDFTDRLDFAAADWCFRLHGWPIMPPLLGVYDFTTGLPPSPPTGVLAYTVSWSHHRSWASTSSPTGWTSPPPTGVSACTASLLCHHCWVSTTSSLACLRHRRLVSSPIRLVGHTTVYGRPRLHRPASLRRHRLVFPPARLAYYATVVGRLCLHHRPASVAADWCPRLYGCLVTPQFMGVHVFTDRLASVATDWCPRLYGWLVTPPFMGVHVFTDRLDFAAVDWCFYQHG
uniref:cysteine dioxygenase n=1 Tax=Oryza sativa subsp. japonica TaxID=39947 RepID=Q10KH2_ORYSJ|nr:hypothetical protein LOC_Os03g26730 [Oryza sativa Japonica Group]